jgi:acetoacetate decarboxylase
VVRIASRLQERRDVASKLQGFFHPHTATGRASLLPSPPWFYSGDLLTIEYRVNPDRISELLPEPLELAPEDPGAVAFIWADWQSCAEDKAQLMDPVLGQYKEAFVVIRCAYEGNVYSRCAYIWVDTDFAIARGLHQGYPKKLGAIHMTRPHPYGPAPRLAADSRFGASLAAADRRLAETRIRLSEPAASNGFVNAHPMAHNRTVNAIDDPSTFRLDEIIVTGAAEAEGGQPWAADVEHFALFESPTEELHLLQPDEVIGAYYRQVGVKWDGGTVLVDNLANPETNSA